MKRSMKGVVVSNKMTKALVVAVFTTKTDPKYKKPFKSREKFSVACEDSSKYPIGTEVEIVECRPVSKTIHFEVAKVA